MPTRASNKEHALEVLAEDVSSLWVPEQWKIPVLEQPPTGIHFLRDFVSLSRPCIIQNAIDERGRPSLAELIDILKNHGQLNHNKDDNADTSCCASTCAHTGTAEDPTRMKVAVTPDGHGDCVRSVESVGLAFVEPLEVAMTLESLVNTLSKEVEINPVKSKEAMSRVFSTQSNEDQTRATSEVVDESCVSPIDRDNSSAQNECTDVYYYSRQNDCLRNELPQVWDTLQLPDSFGWAEEAFGTGPPDAVNLWLGNQRAVSSMHKDHYENLFLVLSGEKVFTLCPPSDVPFLYERPFPRGKFRRGKDSSDWYVDMKQNKTTNDEYDQTTVRWIAADVTRRDEPLYQMNFPLLQHAHPVTVQVKANEMLYLPSLWFHRVSQTQTTLAVNYWYDMRFDSPHWIYFHYLQSLAVQR